MAIKKESATTLKKRGEYYITLPSKTIEIVNHSDAMAVLVYLQSKSENWIVRHSDIKNKFTWGKQRCQNAINELKDLGLVESELIRCEETGKVLGRSLIVYSSPNTHLADVRANRRSVEPMVGQTAALLKDQLLPNNQVITKDQNNDLFDRAFEYFWQNSGLVKSGKKKSQAKFKNLWVHDDDPMIFAQRLVDDCSKRRHVQQFGFDKLHAITYLNNERWNDEVIPNAKNQQSNQSSQRQYQRGATAKDFDPLAEF